LGTALELQDPQRGAEAHEPTLAGHLGVLLHRLVLVHLVESGGDLLAPHALRVLPGVLLLHVVEAQRVVEADRVLLLRAAGLGQQAVVGEEGPALVVEEQVAAQAVHQRLEQAGLVGGLHLDVAADVLVLTDGVEHRAHGVEVDVLGSADGFPDLVDGVAIEDAAEPRVAFDEVVGPGVVQGLGDRGQVAVAGLRQQVMASGLRWQGAHGHSGCLAGSVPG
jgi:hypothetical protein